MPLIKLHPQFKLRIESDAAYGIQGETQEKIKYTDADSILYLSLAACGKFDFSHPLLGDWRKKKFIEIARERGIRPDGEKERERLEKIRAGLPARHTSYPLMLHLGVIDRCNFSCRHCGNDSGPRQEARLPSETIRKIIDECRETGLLKLTFTGGEPLLRRDIFGLIAYARESIPRVSLTSNGWLLDENTARKLARVRVSMVKISLDGLEKTHDVLRRRPGAYRAAVNAIRYLREQGVEVRVQSTLMRQNREDLIALAGAIGRLGVGVHTVVPLSPIGRARRSDMLGPEDYKKFISDFIGRISCLKRKTVYQIRPVFDSDIKVNLETLSTKYICEALTNSMEIKANGDIVPCSFFDLKLGNVHQDRLADIWTSARTNAIRGYFRPENLAGACRSCPSRMKCGGGCLASAYALHHKLYTRDVYCWKQ